MFDKAKMIAQALKVKKALESQILTYEEDQMVIEISGDQKIRTLVVNGVSNQKLVDFLNKALKKSQEQSAKMMQGMGLGLDNFKM